MMVRGVFLFSGDGDTLGSVCTHFEVFRRVAFRLCLSMMLGFSFQWEEGDGAHAFFGRVEFSASSLGGCFAAQTMSGVQLSSFWDPRIE
ncbi:hypothetical protein U1Q18_040354 [Sarracenia purpurea var. burkii]